jgi:hypothetical protein
MDLNQKRELVDALLACPAMAGAGRRNAVVAQLPAQIRTRIQRSDVALVDVNNILVGCLNFEGGLEQLVERVRYFEGGSVSMRAVDAAVRRIGSP